MKPIKFPKPKNKQTRETMIDYLNFSRIIKALESEIEIEI